MGENKSPTSRRYSKKIVVQMHICVRDVAEEKLNRLFISQAVFLTQLQLQNYSTCLFSRAI